MLTPQSPAKLREQADAHLAEFDKLRRHADAVLTSGAPSRYRDVFELYEEECANAEAEYRLAMKLYREAHATENYGRDRRAA